MAAVAISQNLGCSSSHAHSIFNYDDYDAFSFGFLV